MVRPKVRLSFMMFDENAIRAAVKRELAHITTDTLRDNRSLSDAPYARHASPMARYQPMIRLLGDSDLDFLKMPLREGMRWRKERRKLYRGYLEDLKQEVSGCMARRAHSGSAPMETIVTERRLADACLRELRRAAIMHWCRIPGLPVRVRATLAELNEALGYGAVVSLSPA